MSEIFEPVVFDRRNPAAEEILASQMFGASKKPKRLLYCLNTGGSSPFPFVPEVERVLGSASSRYQLVDLMKWRASRIFDLLGAIDRADLVVTTDTAILHLMGASKTPYVAFIANGGGGSLCRGNPALQIRYSETMNHLNQLQSIL